MWLESSHAGQLIHVSRRRTSGATARLALDLPYYRTNGTGIPGILLSQLGNLFTRRVHTEAGLGAWANLNLNLPGFRVKKLTCLKAAAALLYSEMRTLACVLVAAAVLQRRPSDCMCHG